MSNLYYCVFFLGQPVTPLSVRTSYENFPKIVAPFCLSSAVRALIASSSGDDFSGSAKIVMSYFWIYLVAFMLLIHLIETCLDIFPVLSCCDSFWEFLTRNLNLTPYSGLNERIDYLITLMQYQIKLYDAETS